MVDFDKWHGPIIELIRVRNLGTYGKIEHYGNIKRTDDNKVMMGDVVTHGGRRYLITSRKIDSIYLQDTRLGGPSLQVYWNEIG